MVVDVFTALCRSQSHWKTWHIFWNVHFTLMLGNLKYYFSTETNQIHYREEAKIAKNLRVNSKPTKFHPFSEGSSQVPPPLTQVRKPEKNCSTPHSTLNRPRFLGLFSSWTFFLTGVRLSGLWMTMGQTWDLSGCVLLSGHLCQRSRAFQAGGACQTCLAIHRAAVTTPVAAVSGHLPDVHTEVLPATSAAAWGRRHSAHWFNERDFILWVEAGGGNPNYLAGKMPI